MTAELLVIWRLCLDLAAAVFDQTVARGRHAPGSLLDRLENQASSAGVHVAAAQFAQGAMRTAELRQGLRSVLVTRALLTVAQRRMHWSPAAVDPLFGRLALLETQLGAWLAASDDGGLRPVEFPVGDAARRPKGIGHALAGQVE